MRMGITVGFEHRFAVRALAKLGPADEYIFLYAYTGRDEDSRSESTVRELIAAFGRGAGFRVDLTKPSEALEQIYGLGLERVVLAGGPRLLVLLALLASLLRRSEVYVLPEYSAEPLDLTPLTALCDLCRLSPAKLGIVASVSGRVGIDDVAQLVGRDSTTVARYLKDLSEAGIVKSLGGRRREYFVDPLLTTVARLMQNRAGSL
ncbi:CRISPR-associated CARF protein Csa3 [Thermoproteus tenax]|uniref:CRISPR locus-related putative DNA-binding protein Csa3 n=1 Tax=Thermoproteus tenax (strain ATCC 35583 / DSM 2078 / JCM 9277 / NBRC 100435 / Kra 1) TaxID=768679 RepID=CSA3_THETK|nr:CRISPR-associated CARF protein Csa3 [Thermoproteus tenax]G4RJY9.1 RecName: Full=CRISPR locus-related putative DNA-binding protein Csa3 [Thermoproteus tenax Kra 1]CCC81884.1 transcriptional regulator [Thermoproteus tenax Kra 1]